jgi:hypothetical protein
VEELLSRRLSPSQAMASRKAMSEFGVKRTHSCSTWVDTRCTRTARAVFAARLAALGLSPARP